MQATPRIRRYNQVMPPHEDDNTPADRRQFFRKSLSHIMRPAADYIEKKIPKLADQGDTTPKPLRPPGARRLESDFLSTCLRCGSCVDHCPADSITLIKTDDQNKGTPTIEPTRRACVMCDDLTCMKVCPSGALQFVERHEIRIGLAVWRLNVCLRTTAKPSSKDASCQICVDVCPVGNDAIRIDDGRIHVIDPRPTGSGCTGCGVCEEQCPTAPEKAIRVLPYASRFKQA